MSQSGLVAEIRPSWGSRLGAVLCAVLLLALPFVAFLVDTIEHPTWLFAGLMLLFGGLAAWALIDDLTLRIRLYGDRLERVWMLTTRSILLRDIEGLRLSGEDIHIIPKDHASKRFILSRRVAKNPAIAAWLETLRNLDAEDYNKEAAELEADDRLGSTVAGRQRTIAGLRRVAAVLSFAGIGIALWALLFPQPLEVVAALCVGGPMVAILFATVRPDAVQLLLSNNDTPAAGVGGLWLTPAIASAWMGWVCPLIDWRAPALVAIVPAVLFTFGSLLADRRLRAVTGAVFVLLIGYAWGWGGLVAANTVFDIGRPVVVNGRVTRASRPDYGAFMITVVSPDLSHPVERIGVAKERLKAFPVGAKVCLRVFPGRFGWRYAFLTDCPAPPPPTE